MARHDSSRPRRRRASLATLKRMSNRDHDGAADPLRTAIETLEAIARDRGLLRRLSVEERTRLLSAAGDVFNPDIVERRRSAQGTPA